MTPFSNPLSKSQRKKTKKTYDYLFRGKPFHMDFAGYDKQFFADLVDEFRKKKLDMDVDWTHRRITVWLKK